MTNNTINLLNLHAEEEIVWYALMVQKGPASFSVDGIKRISEALSRIEAAARDLRTSLRVSVIQQTDRNLAEKEQP